ncbi:type 2 lanthipeptide synthetase LanM family protein [Bacillus thuringiensis]|uniref:type 2 lanthipeptide synthetase LanM family protein n=2 Tax=Bacillus thuringiensis TaxID=1428 RepID=UPI000CD8FA1E|nr:type 2 lanthipeptide synthetase LanM family protein [Bacillus thuringiensis]QFQ29000.1 type 2 lantipeptide synthetase LanM [Bacillus thuringiensis]
MLKNNIDMLQRRIIDFDNKVKFFLGDSLVDIKKNGYEKSGLDNTDLMELENIAKNAITSEGDNLLFSKLTGWFANSLTQLLNNYNDSVIDKASLIRSVTSNFYQTVRKYSSRTLVFDYNCWKKNQDFNKRTSENNDMFETYQLNFENTDYIIDFFFRFPVLFNLLKNEKRKNINFIQYIIDSFVTDRKQLSAMNDRITGLSFNQGDVHLDGRASTIVYIGNRKVLFKPRKADMEKVYRHVVELYNAKCKSANKIICPNNYYFKDRHWVDFIEHEDCTNNEMIKAFYHNIGVQLAIIYAMNGSDFHCENMIATKQNSIFVDMECLFDREYLNDNVNKNLLKNSVLKTHIIPDLNGLQLDKYVTAIGVQDTGMNTSKMVVETTRNNELCINNQRSNVQTSNNIPSLKSKPIPVKNYIENVVEGFKEGYEFLYRNKEDLLNDLNHKFADYQYRKLLRTTSHYTQILSMSYHPRFLMNEMDRRLFLLLISDDVYDRTIERIEYDALLNNDIPLHTGMLNNTDLYVNSKVLIKNHLSVSPLDAFKEKLACLNNEDSDFQVKLIRLSLKSISLNNMLPISQGTSNPIIEELDYDLKIEEVVGEILKPNYKNIHLNMNPFKDFVSLKIINESLYEGKLGYAFLTFCLYLITRKQKYKNITDNLVFQSIFKDAEITKKTSLGVFSGTASSLYMLYLLYKETKEEVYFRKAKDIMRKYMLNLDKKDYIICDIIDGISGLLIIWSRFAALHPDDKNIIYDIEKLIALLKEHRIQIDSDKVTWDRRLTGFSHGNSGVIFALTAALDYVKDPELDTIIEQALNYETSQMLEDGWKDNRSNGSEGDFNSWCHGSPGILLSRMSLPKKYQNELTKMDEALAYQNTKNTKHHSINLCHGTIGNYLIQYKYAQYSSNEKEIEYTKVNINKIVSEIINIKDLNEQITNMSIDKGLMTGISGVLYAYLYVNYPDVNLPFVLTLE